MNYDMLPVVCTEFTDKPFENPHMFLKHKEDMKVAIIITRSHSVQVEFCRLFQDTHDLLLYSNVPEEIHPCEILLLSEAAKTKIEQLGLKYQAEQVYILSEETPLETLFKIKH